MPSPNLEFLNEIRQKATRTTAAFSEDADDCRRLMAQLGLDRPVEEMTFHDFQGYHGPKGN